MRRWLISFFISVAFCVHAQAATGRVLKVLPHFLDLQGRHTLSPSLYDRDAYQARLRQHREERSGIRFDVQWKCKGPAWEPLSLIVEMRGGVEGTDPKQYVLEQPIKAGGWFSHWSALTLAGDAYQNFGEVTAWRVTLWEGNTLVAEQKSFLW